MWKPDKYLEFLYQELVPYHSSIYDGDWKSSLKEKLSESLGYFPSFSDEMEPALLEKIEMEDYDRLRLEITTYPFLRMPFYLLIPKEKENQKLPVVLALHGHGYGSKEMVGLLPDGTVNNGDAGIHKNFAVELVRKGLAVIVPELIGFGDRTLQKDQHGDSPAQNSCFSIASQLLMLGKTLPGLRINECKRVIDYVTTRKEVDGNRIGCMGFSGGGLVAAYITVLDQRIKAAVISGYTNTFKGSIIAENHCLDNYIPGILEHAEMPELIGLIAPRPLFIEAGVNDALFPIDHVNAALTKIKEIYQFSGAEQALHFDIFPGKHEIAGRHSLDWLVAAL